MTDLTPLRDRLAALCGWSLRPDSFGGCMRQWNWERTMPLRESPDGSILLVNELEVRSAHPFPPNDLTALAAAWPEGVYIEITGGSDGIWDAESGKVGDPPCRVWVEDFPTEYEARLRLTVAVREAIK